MLTQTWDFSSQWCGIYSSLSSFLAIVIMLHLTLYLSYKHLCPSLLLCVLCSVTVYNVLVLYFASIMELLSSYTYHVSMTSNWVARLDGLQLFIGLLLLNIDQLCIHVLVCCQY